MIEIQPPHDADMFSFPSLFLGGSIEMNTAARWQDVVIDRLSHLDAIAWNPRRDDWDSSIPQDAADARFAEQVNWELEAQDIADIIVYYFDPATKSPITLLELGLYAETNKVIVCCPPGFWRKGNVDIVCARYGIPMFETLDDMLAEVEQRFMEMA